jgi:hypothetical protein
MFNAVYDLEEGKRQDIEQTVRMRTKLMAAQFRALKLKTGAVDQVVKMLDEAAN